MWCFIFVEGGEIILGLVFVQLPGLTEIVLMNGFDFSTSIILCC